MSLSTPFLVDAVVVVAAVVAAAVAILPRSAAPCVLLVFWLVFDLSRLAWPSVLTPHNYDVWDRTYSCDNTTDSATTRPSRYRVAHAISHTNHTAPILFH